MEEVGNAGFSEWLRPPVSDSEVSLLTSFNGHQLENCMGASLLTRKESGHDDLGIRQVNHGGVYDWEVDSSRFRAQSEAVTPYDYYSDGEYPLLIHTRQASDMFERYVGPFRVSSSFDDRPGMGVDVGQAVKFVPNMGGYEQKPVSLFPQSGTTEDGILQENLNGNAREDQVCDAACTEEYEIKKECLNENDREDQGSDAVSTDGHEIENKRIARIAKRIARIARENQQCNAQGVWPVLPETSRDLELAETSKGELCHGISFEMSSNQAGNVGSVEDFEVKKDCSNEIAIENPAFYAGKDLEVVAEKPERLLCPDMSRKMDSALEAEGEATMNQEDAILAQAPLEISIKPIVCKSFMRKRPNSSRKRVSRKNSVSPQLEECAPSLGGGTDLFNTNKSEGLATSTCPEADVIDEPTCSSSLVPYTELPSDGSNEGSLKCQAPSQDTNTDSAFALYLSNKNIADETIGRSTRSKAHGKIYKKPIVQDSLFDESNLIFANKMTGKRSTICKTTRSTIWGDLENLKEGLEKKGKVVKFEPLSLHTELGRTNIEAEELQSQGGSKKGNGVRKLQSGKFCDNGQPEQVKISMVGSCRNSPEKTNTKHNKGVSHELESVVASSGFNYHRLNVQGGELLCLNGDAGSGGGTVNQKNMEEERECLEIQIDQCPIDQSTCYLPLEVQKSPGKVEEENAADQHSSESTMCTDETKYHNSIKTETSPKGFNDKNNFDYRVHENENDVCHEEQVAITMKEMHGNSIDTRTKPLEESRSNEYASVPKIEKRGINLGMGLAETQSSSVSSRKLQNQKGFQHGRDLIDTKDRSNKLNMEILKFEEQSETRMLHPQARTVEMHLDEFAKSGTSMENLDTCKTEYRDSELHDMISATLHAEPTGIVGQQELGKRKAKRKGKLKGKPEFPEAGLDVADVTVASVNMLQDENAVKKVRKSKWKKAEKSIYMQRRKSNSQNQRKLLDADGSDHLLVSEDLLSGQMERKSSPEPNDLKSKDTTIFIKEKPVEHASSETEGLESMLLHGKSQARKNIKNINAGNKKTELMGSICERKRKVVRQKNNTGDKKSLYCVQKGLENSLMTNDEPGKGLHSLSSNNDPNSFRITEQQKEVGDLDGIKGQSDSSTDAASPMKMAHSCSSVQMNHEPKHTFSIFSQDLAENLLLENKTLERQRMVGCNNEVAGEDISSCVNEEGAKMITSKVRKYSENIERHCEQPRVGWAPCDDCRKWRCIAGERADAIDETDCKCSCQGNPSTEFADCSIPQEKLNAEINAESNISDVSCEEGDWNGVPIESNNLACMQARDTEQAAWTLIKQNMYLHRNRKTPVIDEMMICHCKPPKDGSLGCGDECLNRMLNIECVQGTCPCGDLCSNQQFQKQQYAKVQCFQCGENCFGLQALEDVAKGTFLIEYVGEVLDIQAYEARQKEYASRSQKHSYFMTLNSIEVIDACVKGNLGRFINHSCDPNCHTEKWMVNGEVSIGLFAIRDIKKGGELTFDYNYLKVIGDAAKKCECGSAECRGFICSDPSVPEAVLPSEVDENCEVPGMLQEDSENEGSQDNKVSLTRECSTLADVAEGELSSQPSERRSECSSALFEKQGEVLNNYGIMKKVNIVSNVGNAFNLKKSKVPTNVEDFEGVEEKLNELLDSDGGICGGKDATKDYLKLLLVTSASGDTDNTAVSHSIRDVSLVLDALLKTRSRTVLFDIMNKNGLQMLHNILKQNCKNYIKIPIVHKLLKVIEFFAENDVLSVDQINSDPACRASESFQEFVCTLTGHNDSEVQEIAQRFRDKWIPRIIKNAENKEGLVLNKVGLIFNDYEMNSCGFSVKEPKMVSRQTDAIDCLSQTPVEQENVADGLFSRSDQYEVSHGTQDLSFPGQDGSEKLNRKNALDGLKTGTKIRKRKSRWDQPTELITQEISSQTNLKCGEISVEKGKDSGSLILHCDKENNAETDQDVSTSGGRWSSEQNHETNIDGNVTCSGAAVQFAISSCAPSEVMSMSNAPGTFGKEQSSLQFPVQQIGQVPGLVDSCVGSSCTLSCSTDVPATQPYMMAHHSKTVYGYPLKSHGNILPHWPLSYGIPINLLANLGRSPTPFPDNMSQPLSTHRLHCPSSSNPISLNVIPNMRPCPGQPVVGCFPRNPQHQVQPFNISLPMQSAAHPLQNVRQPFQMHPGQAVRQCASDNTDYVEPEPPVPGLSPSRSSETPCNSNWPVRGRNKAGHGQTGKPGKRQGKQQRFNYPRFSNYKGPSDRKYKDCFPQKKYSSFKGTWKNRISATFHKDFSLHHPSNGNNLHLQNLQQNSEHVNIANFSEAVSKQFSTFHS